MNPAHFNVTKEHHTPPGRCIVESYCGKQSLPVRCQHDCSAILNDIRYTVPQETTGVCIHTRGWFILRVSHKDKDMLKSNAKCVTTH